MEEETKETGDKGEWKMEKRKKGGMEEETEETGDEGEWIIEKRRGGS